VSSHCGVVLFPYRGGIGTFMKGLIKKSPSSGEADAVTGAFEVEIPKPANTEVGYRISKVLVR